MTRGRILVALALGLAVLTINLFDLWQSVKGILNRKIEKS
jgi:hypothetical protein